MSIQPDHLLTKYLQGFWNPRIQNPLCPWEERSSSIVLGKGSISTVWNGFLCLTAVKLFISHLFQAVLCYWLNLFLGRNVLFLQWIMGLSVCFHWLSHHLIHPQMPCKPHGRQSGSLFSYEEMQELQWEYLRQNRCMKHYIIVICFSAKVKLGNLGEWKE